MKSKLVLLLLVVFTISSYGQEFENGTIVTKHYDTIANVKIKKIIEIDASPEVIFKGISDSNELQN
mgnify:CR=1 FL=1